ncbi:MAG: hypothetical protein AABZ34_14870 [Nitrospirota bacterium]
MHSHASTGTSLATDIVNKMIELDSLLAHADAEDKGELAERLSNLPASEVLHILELLIERGLIQKTPEHPSEVR